MRQQSQDNFRISTGACLLAAAVMILFGATYRQAAGRLKAASSTAIRLERELKEIPFDVGPWHGRDVKLPASVIRSAGNDDFINRIYINSRTTAWANVYVAYSARPRTMLGHKPDVCWSAAGWVCDETEKSTFEAGQGKALECLLHRFHKPDGSGTEMAVLNYYVVNGHVSSDERLFSGLGWRTPNIKGDAARYVAQVQVSSSLETTVREMAAEVTGVILSFLPEAKSQ